MNCTDCGEDIRDCHCFGGVPADSPMGRIRDSIPLAKKEQEQMTKLPEGVEKLCAHLERGDQGSVWATALIRAQARVIEARQVYWNWPQQELVPQKIIAEMHESESSLSTLLAEISNG